MKILAATMGHGHRRRGDTTSWSCPRSRRHSGTRGCHRLQRRRLCAVRSRRLGIRHYAGAHAPPRRAGDAPAPGPCSGGITSREERPDVVHAHARIPAFLCGTLQRTMGFPFVTTCHWVFAYQRRCCAV
ncbi:MAG: glycosyltransferase [Lawsonibacter sp.]